jgi:uncharacterized protein YwqG
MTTEDLKSKYQNAGFELLWQKIERHTRQEIRIAPEEALESAIKVGQSKIGGRPDLPQNQSWFREENGRSLSFSSN